VAARKRNKKRIPDAGAVERPEPQLDLFAAESSDSTAAGGTKYYFSTRLERLIDALRLEMNDTRPVDFFARAPAVWVPNRNLRRWIQMELAEREGVSAHLDFQFLESGLWGLLFALDPEGERPQPLDRVDLEYLVLSVLQEVALESDPVFAPFFEYLRGGSENKDRQSHGQLYQLAVRLAGLFQEYEYHRGDMIAAWSEVADLAGASEEQVPRERERRAIYLAERALWRRVFGVGGERQGGRLRALDRFGGRALSLSAYARIVLVERRDRLEPLDRAVHIFGMSQMSAFHLSLLGVLGEFVDLRMYFPFAPAHWNDALGRPAFAKIKKDVPHGAGGDARSRWREIEARSFGSGTHEPGEAHSAGKTPAVEAVAERLNGLWARPARELMRLLARYRRNSHRFYWDAGDCARFENADANSDPRGESSLLKSLQSELLYGSASGDAGRLQDASIQIIGCPGLRREAETIYHNILFQMGRDPTLRLTDIAVLVPDMQKYRPVLQAVFDADRDDYSGALRVPYNLSDFSAGDASVYGAGVTALLALANSEFTRKDLFELFLNPCFLSAHRLKRAQVLGWLEWAEQLKIYRGMNERHQAELGIEPDGRYTWTRALERLRLGTIMATPRSPGDFRHFASLVPYSDLESGANDSIGVLSAVCSDLFLSLRESRDRFERGDLRGFDTIRAALDRHLQAPDDRPGESGVRAGVFSAVHRMSRHASATGALPSFELFREILAGQVGGVAGNRGNYLAGGVTIAALQPMRPIPFRVVYVPGMGEGDFPGHPDLSVLNLRNLERRVGDATMPEANRMLFLENLLSVRDRLYLSYVNRDVQRDTDYHPCSVVTELKTGLARFCDAEASPEYREGRVPLRLTGEEHLFFEASDESDALACYSRPDRVLALRQYLRAHPELPAKQRAALANLVRDQSARIAHLQTPIELYGVADAAGQSLRLRDLHEFLRDPIGALLRRRLGLFDERDQSRRALEEDEGFFLDARDRRAFLREALQLQLREVAPDLDVFGEVFADARRRDRLPRGAFAELENATLGREFTRRARRIFEACGDVKWLPELRVGSGDRSEAAGAPDSGGSPFYASAWAPWNDAAATPAKVEVHASLRDCFVRPGDGAGGERPGVMILSFAGRARSEDFLTGFLSVLLLQALSTDAEREIPAAYAPYVSRPWEVLVIARGETRSFAVDVPPDTAAAYLRDLAADFFEGRFDTLPLALIEHRALSRRPHMPESARAGGAKRSPGGVSYVDELRATWEDHADDFYQMELARLLPARFPPDAEALVRRRYALPFASIAGESAARDAASAKTPARNGGPA
jgi:exodeoxyribonuclease V gamma subunit